METYGENFEYDFSGCIMTEEEAGNLLSIQRDFLNSYAASKDKIPVDEWLPQELHRQLPERSEAEISEMSTEIMESLKVTEEMKVSQQKAIDSGRSKESWLASVLMQSTSNMSAKEIAKYLQGLDDAVKNANEAMHQTIMTKGGAVSMNPRLDGFIAEQYHAQTFNMNAEASGSQYRAKVLEPNGSSYNKNSVDIEIINQTTGKVERRYQSKYYSDANATEKAFEHGNYRGQRRLVPDGQEVNVANSVNRIEAPDGTSSTPLSKGKAKEMQEDAQGNNWHDFNWNEYNEYSNKKIALEIGKNVGRASLQGAAVGAGMAIAAKVLDGEPIDGEEVVETAIASGADFGVKTATAGALKVAAEKEILPIIPKGTPASTLTNIAFVAVENVKVMGKVANGELTAKEGIDAMQQTTGSCVAGLAASEEGAKIGAFIGSFLGPAGMAVGGFLGGTVGYMAGSTVGRAVVKGVQKVCETAVDVVKSVGSAVVDGISSLASGFASLFGL